MLTIEFPDKIERRIKFFAKKSGKTVEEFLLDFLIKHIEYKENICNQPAAYKKSTLRTTE